MDRTFDQMVDCFIDQVRLMQIEDRYKFNIVGMITALQTRREMDNNPKCKFCGGSLSEIREHDGKNYRHCYGCHFDRDVDG